MIPVISEVPTIAFWNYLALVVNIIAFIVLYMRAKKDTSFWLFFYLQLTLSIWQIGKILKTVAPTVELRWYCICFYYFGITFIAPILFELGIYLNNGFRLAVKKRVLLYLLFSITYLFVLTNPFHNLFYCEYDFKKDSFGILFYVFLIINYSILFPGIILCGKNYIKKLNKHSRKSKFFMSFGLLLPLFVNMLYLTRILEKVFIALNWHIFDVTPIGYTMAVVVFVYATYKYDFLEMTPIMKHNIVRKIKIPLLIMTEDYMKVYNNKLFEKIFYDIDIINIIKANTIFKYSGHYYSTYISKLKHFGENMLIVRFNDITPYELAKIALKEENEQLAKTNNSLQYQIEKIKETSHIGARTYIARELHDVLGHSLVVTNKLLEVCKVYVSDKDKVIETLNNANSSLNNGFEEMKDIVNKDQLKFNTTKTLEKEIRSLLKLLEFSDIKFNFVLRAPNINIQHDVYDTIKKVIIEMVTNTIKHSEATYLILSLTKQDYGLVLQSIDNGVGSDKLVEGNGLKGIRARVNNVGGYVEFNSESEEGFSCKVVIKI